MRTTPVLGELDLDQILGGTLGAATHRSTLTAERREGVGIVLSTVVHIFCAVFEALQAVRGAGDGDVAEGAFANVHKFAIPPVRADGEVRPVVVARVEEESLLAGAEAWFGEAGAHDSHEQSTLMDVVSGLVGPAVPAPATG
ncbi:unnamed protein product [Aspergillus oryzae]|uniref:Unnamed protein product n=1 Tax=Aspergillus oryzae TaxID=5062 RepID=A0AAN5C1U4_ASPOZ|nr:unnamed protein product [Aspergillus oryzae]